MAMRFSPEIFSLFLQGFMSEEPIYKREEYIYTPRSAYARLPDAALLFERS